MLSPLTRLARGQVRNANVFKSYFPAMTAAQRPFAAKKGKGPRYEDSIANGAQALYLESMYSSYKAGKLSGEWAKYFQDVEKDIPAEPPLAGKALANAANAARQDMSAGASGSGAAAPAGQAGMCVADDTLAISYLIRAYQQFGHHVAKIDPLGLDLWRLRRGVQRPQQLDAAYYGLTEADMDRPLNLNTSVSGGHLGFLQEMTGDRQYTLRQIIDELERVYCGSIGTEYTHIDDIEKQNYIRHWIESSRFLQWSPEKRLKVYERVVEADYFERFLGKKFKTTKRFGVDGCETLIAGMKGMIDRAANLGCEDVVIGMPHRGRLNVLANVLKKPLKQVFAEFRDSHYDIQAVMEQLEGGDWASSGDVKYHLGAHSTREYGDGKSVAMSLEANPSHLETVGPVALGRARAKQFFRGDTDQQFKEVMPILMHGDAAFAGQGVCYESMQLAGVKDFSVGGTIHIVVNNQVGFTTNPWNSRSTEYCSDLGKTFNCPIFHVNGDDGFAVVEACELAAEYRQKYHTDVVIDIVCFRRFGHNEIDNPDFTQPKLYEQVRKHGSSEEKVAQAMLAAGHSQKEIDDIRNMITERYELGLKNSETYKPKTDPSEEWVSTPWKGYFAPLTIADQQLLTGVPKNELVNIGSALAKPPPQGFRIHKTIEKLLENRKGMIESGKGIDWGMAEALAFGSLLQEGYHVRLTGQDVQRGTFSHRHCVVTNQDGWDQYCFLNNIGNSTIRKSHKSSSLSLHLWEEGEQGTFVAQNSILSEYGVLGFELGYSYESPSQLNLWEAQFGDFSDTAQVMFDTYIAAGEHKWFQQSGLTMLLPHGYDGQGSEHSSCRVERFLQMADDDEDHVPQTNLAQIQQCNWQIYNCTTPANYFHALRKQCQRKFRKPLVVMSPKNLLRHKSCISDLDEFTSENNTKFLRVYGERNQEIAANPDKVDRIIFCTGQLYYQLAAERDARGLHNVAICTVEQLSPFPFDRVLEQLNIYKNVDHGDGLRPGQIYWAQEEPKNMGAWPYVKPRFVTTCREGKGIERDTVMRYVGRRAAASPATGMPRLHQAEQAAIIEGALGQPDDSADGGKRGSPLLGHQS